MKQQLLNNTKLLIAAIVSFSSAVLVAMFIAAGTV
jgi:hypothetical protein